MFFLVGLNDLKKELCFHCKWGFLILQTLSILLLSLLILEQVPYLTMFIALVIFGFIIFVRSVSQNERMVQKKRMIQEMQEKAKIEK
mmetsp:Transcript_13487/g.22963  ORF Transcript_13487/g.22963 Transcript_13487/m.22963 type:complete len:87 (+) Transcript_13487:525-785(+)